MSQLHRDKTLALAAIFQAAGLAAELAKTGNSHPEAEAFLRRSSLVLDTDDISQIYPDARGLEQGLMWLEGCLMEQGRALAQAGEIVRLALGIVQVEKHLVRSPDVQNSLRQRLETVARQQQFNPDMGDSELAQALGSVYVDTLGSLQFRVQLRGNAQHLQATGMAERIRAILLAGVRAAWLWRRLGGRRWHLIFTRSQILTEIREIAKTV